MGIKVEVRSESVRNDLRDRRDHCVDFSQKSFLAIKWRSDPVFSYRVSVPSSSTIRAHFCTAPPDSIFISNRHSARLLKEHVICEL